MNITTKTIRHKEHTITLTEREAIILAAIIGNTRPIIASKCANQTLDILRKQYDDYDNYTRFNSSVPLHNTNDSETSSIMNEFYHTIFNAIEENQ